MHKILGHSEKVNQRHLWMHKILGHSEKVNQRHLWMHKILGHWEKGSLRESQPSKLAVGSQIVSHILRMWRLMSHFARKLLHYSFYRSHTYSRHIFQNWERFDKLKKMEGICSKCRSWTEFVVKSIGNKQAQPMSVLLICLTIFLSEQRRRKNTSFPNIKTTASLEACIFRSQKCLTKCIHSCGINR